MTEEQIKFIEELTTDIIIDLASRFYTEGNTK